jgi:hypothetical protein
MNFPQQYYTLQFMRHELEGKTSNDYSTVSEIQRIAIRASEVILEEIPHQHTDHVRVAREKTLALLQKAIVQADLYQEEEATQRGQHQKYHVADTRTPALDAVEMYTRIVFSG